jgi:hypothetical protein
MIDFIRGSGREHSAEGGGVIEFSVMEEQRFTVDLGILIEVMQPGAVEGTCAAHNSVDLIALFKQ